MSARDAAIASRRFGLGARPGDLASIAANPQRYVLAALDRRDAALIQQPDLEPSHSVFAAAREAQMATREERKAAKSAAGSSDTASAVVPDADRKETNKAVAGKDTTIERPGRIRRDAFRKEAAARLHHAVTSDHAYLERLVMFWSGHFCVSVQKGPVRGLAGAYEREAIRPNVLGRFSDMLRAVEQHPAMLIYLDNQVSSGPNSKGGLNRGRGADGQRPFPIPAHRTGRADLRHPALRLASP